MSSITFNMTEWFQGIMCLLQFHVFKSPLLSFCCSNKVAGQMKAKLSSFALFNSQEDRAIIDISTGRSKADEVSIDGFDPEGSNTLQCVRILVQDFLVICISI